MSRCPGFQLATRYLQILGVYGEAMLGEGGEGQGGIRLRLRIYESMRTLLVQI